MCDKMLWNEAAGPDDWLWGLNAPSGLGVEGRPVPSGHNFLDSDPEIPQPVPCRVTQRRYPPASGSTVIFSWVNGHNYPSNCLVVRLRYLLFQIEIHRKGLDQRDPR